MGEYVVSARKYRPLTFDTVVGQSGLTTTLKNAIATGKLAHAYLFCGPRGVGKTTSARIFAKNINCLNPTAEGDACEQCESCRAFNERRSFNIHELDAASNNSVDDIRTLIEEVQIPPQVGRYKVFIIDEVHMLSQAAFNAFLKTLEEPPAHVIFILATTERHKILPTILSRCQVYDFSRITVKDIVDHLRKVAEKEGYTADDEALAVIAERADGGMRDALSIFDQCAAFTEGQLTYERVTDHLGVLNTNYYFQLVDQLLTHDIPQSMLLLNDVIARGFDPGLFVSGLATHLRDVMMARQPSTLPLLQCSETMRNRFAEQAARANDRFIYRALRLCNTCDQNYRTSRNRRLLVEITLIEIAQSDDDPVAGRPATELKPIFNTEGSLSPAGSSEAKASNGAQDNQSAQTNNAPQTYQSAQPNYAPQASRFAAPVVHSHEQASPPPKLSGFGISITSPISKSSQTADTPASIQAVSAIVTPTAAAQSQVNWTHETAQTLWLQFAASLPPEDLITAQRMRAIEPTVSDNHTLTATIDNSNLLNEWRRTAAQIERYMQAQTGLSDIRIDIQVNEQPQTIVMSRSDQYNDMAARNPLLNKLKEAFKLDFA